jgi:GntR family transcriptional repressor for pyruvate dehydrogenase complex
MLENFSEIKVDNPADKIIRQIRNLITSGQLNPGDKLPPERKLSEKFGVGRSTVRDAIRKLEFYNIVKTYPQSGTFINGLGPAALEGLISDILDLENTDFASLVETRVLLETNSASFAAKRRTSEDITLLEKALEAYEAKVSQNLSAVEEDLLFHIQIAEASKNKVLKSLLLVITPDIVKNFVNLEICSDDTTMRRVQEHRDILQRIIDKDAKGARKAMQDHLNDVLKFSKRKNIY